MRLLLWKGVLVKKRQKFWLAVELLVPLILFVILALVRTRDFTDFETHCHYDSKGFPSAGILPFLHSFLCSFSNTCHLSPTTGDETQFIHNGTDPDESLLVDFLYYSSLQLGWIGENPVEFSRLLGSLTRAIHIIARMNGTQIGLPTARQLFLPSYNLTGKLEELGMSRNAAEVVAESRLTPEFFVEAYRYAEELSSMSAVALFFSAVSSVPIFCNETLFSASFLLPPEANLTAEDHQSLCRVTPLDLLNLNQTEIMKNMVLPFSGTPSAGNQSKPTSPRDLLEPLMISIPLLQQQPLYEGFLKRSDNFNLTFANISSLIFCGGNPFDTSTDGLGPLPTNVKTPFDELKNNLVEFIEKIVPGRQEHDKQFCHGVWVRDDLNCSALESAFMQRLRPLFIGYILVTPPSPVVEEMIDMLNNPLRFLGFLRQKLYEYPELSDNLQDAFYQSDLRAASMNILAFLRSYEEHRDLPQWMKSLEFLLEHVFAPPSDPYSFGGVTKNLTETVNKYITCFLTDRFVLVANESAMEETALCLTDYQQYFSGIVIVNMTDNATEFEPLTTYKIRHLPTLSDNTRGYVDSPRRLFDRNMPFNDLKYLTYGFSFLQEAIDRAIIAIRANSTRPVGMYSQQEPYPCINFDTFNVAGFFALFVILSYIIPAALLVKNIVHEKELRLKEQMRIMGLGDMVHLWSWAIISLVLNIISTFVIVLITKFGHLLKIDFWLLFVFLSLFAMSSIAMCLLLSTFFSNANISTAATCIVYFLFFFPFQLSVRARSATFTQFTLIFPQTTLGYGMAMLAYAAESDEATWSDIKSIRLEAYDVGLVECMVAFAVEIVTFIILAWYKSAVSPGIYGVSLPWYFCLTRSYWCPRSVSVSDHDPPYDSQPAGDTFDVEPSYLNMTVHISGMSKVYGNGTKALDQLSMRLYEDQITALLGHNGAGKTTTMSILCGLYSPSSGSAHVYGMDIRSEMQGVRDVLGVCPQYNVLFSHLTVAEQLKLFAALKGTPDDELKHEVDEILDAVSLVDKADALASTLSGGMKRRLSIGIALVGGSRFVILDEPTAGVDVNSRKEIWTLLQNNKKGRTILLSTHHMDEADILSDRIAILSEGRLISLGSSIFLKNKFGDSFQMFACKKERSIDYTAVITRITTEATVPIRLSDETEEELVFSIPITTDSYKLEKFFSFFDSHKDAYHLGEYGISAPTLQEIFVRLSPQREYIVPRHKAGILGKLKRTFRGGQVQTDQQHLMRTPASGNAIAEAGGSRDASPAMFDEELMPAPLRGWELARSHTKAILRSRCQYTVRSKKHVLFEVILPICLLFLCELYAKIQFSDTTSSYVSSQPELPLIAEMYGNNTRSYISVWDRNTSSLSHQILNSFEEPPDMGTRCVNNVPVFERKLPKKVSSWMRKEKQLVSGCDYEAGNGTFNWNVNETEIPYNEDLTCTCSENHFWNCTAEDYPLDSVPLITLNSTMEVWDMSYRNISQMRMVTRWSWNSSYFVLGGFSLGHTSLRARTSAEVQLEIQGWHTLLAGLNESAIALNVSISTSEAPEIYDPFLKNMTMSDFVAGVLGSMETKDIVKAWFNNKMYTSLPVYTGFLSNALLRIESKDTDPSDLGIITINHPMNQTVKGSFDSEGSKKLIVFRIVLIMLVLCVIPAGFTVFLVEDRICDAYHLQLVSGLSRRTYWMTGYVFDMSIYTASLVAILLIYVIFGVKEFAYSFEAICCFFLVFLLYGLCAVLWAYVLQRRFEIPALSFVLISVGTFFVGIVASLTVMVIEQLMQKDPTLIAPHTICSIVFLLLPQYNLGMAIFRGSFVFQLIQIGENYLKELHRPDLVSELPIPSLLEWNLMGKHCLCLVIHTFAAALTLFVLERQPFGFLRRWEQIRTQRLLECSKGVSDEDVIAEMRKVDEIENASDNPLIVKDLAKAYTKTNLAVRSVSFAVDRGECFGLLGLNGAGKTTTFAMLTQKIRPGAGSVRIHGRSMVIGDRSSFDQVGYCPQFDALNMKLTTIENIELFARIRGIPETHIKPLVSKLLVSLHLSPYSSTVTSALSGGNRRKLSVAIALISHPSLVLLDEPSAGMDPGSQQFLWKVIDQLRKSGKAVVITSHSMEECEALCTRIAIMDKGQIRCIGSKQHLKNKFGEGHSLTVKMKSQSDARLAGEFVLERLKGAKIESIHCSTLFLHIDREISSISGIYRVVNQLKKQFSVEDFSLSQSTLAEVFHSLAASSSSSVSSGHTVSTAETDLTD
ncbi:hypothetical protein Y032_0119g792 [Ancylostoma ceylanicum]|uniref:ABC transporter domain-containing protein n=1 Tax=Ancylostoma ceylanicum TaxID=53326 RepID=A0A016TB21_9BILA|nr:hypothetical protein Y032_0119g792 [Ancylostoma ceylanicum]